jgi:acetylornithine deacetylase/succinyl-diaminopimelate desuccinylase-like protein
LDSQPYGGRFDVKAGVLAGVEAVKTMVEQGTQPAVPIEVVAFCDEESWRFKKGLFGSRGIVGKLEPGELERKDQAGITRRQALIDFGCDPEKLEESVYPTGSIGAYLELHIEQGPILDVLEKPVGIVTGIAGPLWLTVKVKGFAGHAGSVPMELRQDALLGAAEMIKEINRIARQEMGAPAPEIMSGPFHDAVILSEVCDIGMFFVRCKEGISHNPAEFASDEDLAVGTQLLYQTALRVSSKLGSTLQPITGRVPYATTKVIN